ncbi:MAG: sulfatase-like hydrolase/transferase [Planctomycetaceae bacterium]|nr:sulfatase-like hydrolase/transferase [Planctomycetaceae bacterium]
MTRVIALFAAAVATLSVTVATAQDRPNIILIMSDDMGFSDIGCYGGEIQTPVLDGLAEGGLRFSQFYNTGRCCPTRASLLTGLYPHQAGVGHMLGDKGLPGYTTGLNRNCLTIGEAMRLGGYRTYATGKWHVTKETKPSGEHEKFNWPLQRGFDRYFGTIHGAGSFYDPNSLTRDNELIAPDSPEFFYTDAISTNAAQFVRDHSKDQGDKPFFMYVAFTAAHWPMHARPHNIEKYDGVYNSGWDAVRAARYDRVKRLGLVDPSWEMTPRDAKSPAWEDATDKQWEIALMQVYAAMIDCMDQGIGRIVGALKETDGFDNTVIFFLQDNGGCAEGMGRGDQVTYRVDDPETIVPMQPGELQYDMIPQRTRDGKPVRQGRGVMPGPADTYLGYGLSWANASNTPFREYKHWVHEGGISTPLIVHWPKGIAAGRRGKLEHQPGHLIDVMATCVDLGGVDYPAEYAGNPITPLEGVSLRPAFAGGDLDRKTPIFWEHEANCALRDGKWKIVRKGTMGTGETTPWELYDMEADRTELHDLAAEMPDRVKAMADAWEALALHTKAKPWPWGMEKQAAKKPANKKKSFELNSSDELAKEDAPQTSGRSFSIEARLASTGDGVVVAQGGVTHGYTLYVKDGKPVFSVRFRGQMVTITGGAPLPASPCTLGASLTLSGSMVLTADGKEVARTQTPGPITTPVDGLTIGRDGGDPVGPYQGPQTFKGEIEKVTIRLLPPQ